MGMGHLFRIQKLVNKISKVIGAETTLLTQRYTDAKSIYMSIGVDHLYQMPAGITEEDEIEFVEKNLKNRYSLFINDQLQSSKKIASCFVNKAEKSLAIDDTGLGAGLYDLLINVLYPNKPALNNEINGFEYLILPNLQKQKDQYAFSRDVTAIFVNQGAADTWGGIPDIINDLQNLSNIMVLKILLGPAFLHYKELADVISETKHRIEVYNSTDDVLSIAQGCQLAILGAGNTMFEILSIGVPVIACTREEKELITIKRLLEENLVQGEEAVFNSYSLVGSIEQLIYDHHERNRLFMKNRSVFSYKGLNLIIEKIEGML
jgi:spore coat polysaccharide biosynthesis predicted glycosyltransferase SpsG